MQIIAYGYLVNDRTRYPLKSLGGQQRTVVTLFLTYSFKDTKHCYPKSRNLMDSCYTGIVCEFQVQVLIPDIFSKINLVQSINLIFWETITLRFIKIRCQATTAFLSKWVWTHKLQNGDHSVLDDAGLLQHNINASHYLVELEHLIQNTSYTIQILPK